LKKPVIVPFGTMRKGKVVKLNDQRLTCQPKKPYAEVLFFGDLHLGHPTCLLEKAKENLDYCLNNRIHVLLMGDLIECGITGSVGDSVYTQKLNPQEQLEDTVELLSPLAQAGLILGLHGGNHEDRVFKTTGINVAKMMAGTLGVPYLHQACWNIFRVGKQSYTVYSMHGASGSRFIYTKLKAATDISHYFRADVIAHAHVHDVAAHTIERQSINKRMKKIVYEKHYVVLTGHYLGYQLSYAQMKGMPPSHVGSPKLQFFSDRHDIHSST